MDKSHYQQQEQSQKQPLRGQQSQRQQSQEQQSQEQQGPQIERFEIGQNVTFGLLCRQATEYLEAHQVPDAAVDAWLLMSYAFHMSRADYFSRCSQRVGWDRTTRQACTQQTQQCRLYEELINRRSMRVPLQYLTHEQNFMGIDFYVDESVLIPRFDTENLVNRVLEDMKEQQATHTDGFCVLDLCTGSGCILLSILRYGNVSQGVGTDISEAALRVARKNGEALQTELQQPKFSPVWLQGDLFDALEGTKESYQYCFDIITSNPPYIAETERNSLEPEVLSYEPELALFGEDEGISFYRRIGADAGRYLKAGGRLYLEIGCSQAAAVIRILQTEGYKDLEVIQDLAGLDRVVCGTRI